MHPLDFKHPDNLHIIKEGKQHQVSVAIDAIEFDKLAISLCKKRKLHGILGGPVGLEFGSPDCNYE